ncbi:MAG: SOS response-associated peptidase [Paracoccaceae bacterium]|nr:SOS response-associated peptidase [Paracoccaceae bacterium]
MPGRFFLTTPIEDIAAALAAELHPAGPDSPRLDIAPGEDIRVLTQDGRLQPMRWGLIPMGRKNARGRPVMETIVNARSETVFDKSAFDGVERAVVPADGWYEWTGPKGRKMRWRIVRKTGAPLYFAAITDVWEAPGGRRLPQVATITTEPNADVREIHHRMGAILAPEEVPRWLDGNEEEARALLRPLDDGLLGISRANDFPRD